MSCNQEWSGGGINGVYADKVWELAGGWMISGIIRPANDMRPKRANTHARFVRCLVYNL